jgi:hypothetical protein
MYNSINSEPTKADEKSVSRTVDAKDKVTGEINLLNDKTNIYAEHEIVYRNATFDMFRFLKSQYQMPRREFNDLSYPEMLQELEDLDNAYGGTDIDVNDSARKEKKKIKLVSGLSREKVSSSVAVVMSQYYEPEAAVFDKNDVFMNEVGNIISELVIKSQEIEKVEDKMKYFIRAMVALGTSYTIETANTATENKKKATTTMTLGSLSTDWEDTPTAKCIELSHDSLHPRCVYLYDYSQPDIQKQPHLAIAIEMPIATARSIFGGWERWKYVPTTKDSEGMSWYTKNASFTSNQIEGFVEVVFSMSSLRFKNEYNIYINGVQMLPVKKIAIGDAGEYRISGFPLTAISYSGLYPIVKWDLEVILNFAIGKGQIQKTMLDQQTLDILLPSMLKKILRSASPSMGSTRKRYNPDIIDGGQIVHGVQKDDLFSLLPEVMLMGVTSSEFSFYEKMKQELDEKSLSREFMGDSSGSGEKTATQFTYEQKQQMLKFASLLDGAMKGIRQMAELRFLNGVLPFWMKKQDGRIEKVKNGISDVYKSVTLARDDSAKGDYNSVIHIGKTYGLDSYDILEEEAKAEKLGRKEKYKFLDPDMIDFLSTNIYWTVQQKQKDNDIMSRLLFIQNVTDSMNLFGPEAHNIDQLKRRYAQINHEKYGDWYLENSMIPENVQSAMSQSADGTTLAKGGMNSQSFSPSGKTNVNVKM